MMSYISGMDDPASQYLQRWVLKVRCQIFIVGLSIEKKIPFWEKLVERYISNKSSA